MPSSNAELSKLVGVSEYPTLVVVCNGDLGSVERYRGQPRAEPMSRFLDEFVAGKRCRQGACVTAQKESISSKGHACVGGGQSFARCVS